MILWYPSVPVSYTQLSDATKEQAGQISQAMEQLSSAAEEMAENVQNISDRMDEICLLYTSRCV